MSVYSQEETVLILKKLAAMPPTDIKYKKFERLGIEMSEDEPAASEGDEQVNSCSVCRKILPSAHLLDLHVSENHDSFFAVKAEKQPMYACYLKACQLKFWTPIERKDHSITQHKFPANFRFDSSFISIPKPPLPNVEEKPTEKVATKMDTSETIKPKTEPTTGRQLGATPKTGFQFGIHTKKGFASGPKKKSGNKKASNGHSAMPMETMNEDLSRALPASDDEEDLVPEMDAKWPSWLGEKPKEL